MSGPKSEPKPEATAPIEEKEEQPSAAGGDESKDTPYDELDEKTAAAGEDEYEEEETCGFCIFMKGGGCKDAFTAWSKCVDRERDAGNDFTEECKEATLRLRECMLANKDYYAPLLEEEEAEYQARKAAEEAAAEKAQSGGETTEAAAEGAGSDAATEKE